MLTIDSLINEIYKTTKIDKEIVDDVCRFVFKYTADTMKDKDDASDILFNNLFKFKLKNRFKHEKNTSA